MSLRVKLHKDGQVTISGIPYRDIKSILTSASLHHYDNPYNPMPEVGELASIIAENNAENQAWHDNQHKLINYLLKELDDAVRGEYKKAPATKAQRLRKVKEDRDFRRRVNELFDE